MRMPLADPWLETSVIELSMMVTLSGPLFRKMACARAWSSSADEMMWANMLLLIVCSAAGLLHIDSCRFVDDRDMVLNRKAVDAYARRSEREQTFQCRLAGVTPGARSERDAVLGATDVDCLVDGDALGIGAGGDDDRAVG